MKGLPNNVEWMILITLSAVAVTSIYTFFFVTPIYEATTDVLTLNPASEQTQKMVHIPLSQQVTWYLNL